jgi:hypothetical protein
MTAGGNVLLVRLTVGNYESALENIVAELESGVP